MVDLGVDPLAKGPRALHDDQDGPGTAQDASKTSPKLLFFPSFVGGLVGSIFDRF